MPRPWNPQTLSILPRSLVSIKVPVLKGLKGFARFCDKMEVKHSSQQSALLFMNPPASPMFLCVMSSEILGKQQMSSTVFWGLLAWDPHENVGSQARVCVLLTRFGNEIPIQVDASPTW